MKTGTRPFDLARGRLPATGNSKKVKVFGFLFFAWLFVIGPLAWAAEKFISKAPNADGTYCHLKFAAISESTLFSDRPVLKHPSEGDIRDFYGPCDYDPLGREEIRRQRADYERARRRRYGSD